MTSVAATAFPPLAGTRYKGSVAERVNTIVPSAFHAPPRVFIGASARACTSPPAMSIRFNWPPAKNPTDRLSGDQNGTDPFSTATFSVPTNGVAVSESIGRSQSCVFPSTVA